MGRPSKFTTAMTQAFCERIATGESLRSICNDPAMPSRSTVMRWLEQSQAFQEQYARARQIGLDVMADELLVIADDGTGDSWVDDDGVTRTNADVVARSKLRVDARKWLLSKLAPKKYGDKVGLTGADGESAPSIDIRVTFGN